MTKQLAIPFTLFLVFSIYGQEEKILIGKVYSDSLEVEGIHIYNKSSGKGTITNNHGEFNMPVKLNDTLLISGLQFLYQELIIDRKRIENSQIAIHLFQKINVLEEVIVRQHKLIGNLTEDSFNAPLEKLKVNAKALDFSMIDFSRPVTNKIDDIDRMKPPPIIGMVDPAYMMGVGGTVGLGTYKSKEQKKLEKLEEKDTFNNKIKALITKEYFTDTLKIPENEIDYFIEHCIRKGLTHLFNSGRRIEAIEIIIEEAPVFLATD